MGLNSQVIYFAFLLRTTGDWGQFSIGYNLRPSFLYVLKYVDTVQDCLQEERQRLQEVIV